MDAAQHLPPTDIPPSELWLALTAAPRPAEVQDWPGQPGKKVRIQVLRLDEHETCRLTAAQHLKDRKFQPSELPGDVYADAVAVEVLWRALVRPDPIERPDGTSIYWPIAPNADALRKVLSADELVALFNMYLTTQHRLGPTETSVRTGPELDAWISRLAEAEDEFPLASFTWPQLAELCFLLAHRVASLSESQESLSPSSPPTSESGPVSSDSGTT